MNRVWIGSTLLAALLVLGLWVNSRMDRTLLPLADILEEASQAALAGDVDKSLTLARQAKGQWDTAWRRTALFSDHTPMDEIDGIFAQLASYREDAAHLSADCAQLATLLRAVAEAHSPAWWNVF